MTRPGRFSDPVFGTTGYTDGGKAGILVPGAGEVILNPHVVLNEKGRAVVRGTRSTVTMVVRDHLNGGMTPAEMHEAYPHLSLAAIHAALSYYYDHQAELDAETEASDRMVEAMQAAAGESPLAKKWRERNPTS